VGFEDGLLLFGGRWLLAGGVVTRIILRVGALLLRLRFNHDYTNELLSIKVINISQIHSLFI
jgi:hypothetical protein